MRSNQLAQNYQGICKALKKTTINRWSFGSRPKLGGPVVGTLGSTSARHILVKCQTRRVAQCIPPHYTDSLGSCRYWESNDLNFTIPARPKPHPYDAVLVTIVHCILTSRESTSPCKIIVLLVVVVYVCWLRATLVCWRSYSKSNLWVASSSSW